MTTPAAVVSAPQAPGPLVGSILSSLTPETEIDERWEGGLTWMPAPDGSALRVWVPCTNDEAQEMGDAGRDIPTEFPLFYVLADGCNARVFQEIDYAQRIVDALDRAIDPALSNELWFGTIGLPYNANVRYLAGGSPNFTWNTTDPMGSDAVEPLAALVALQTLIFAGGFGSGVLHLTPMVATVLMGDGLLTADGKGRIFDAYGNLVLIHNVNGVGGPDETEGDGSTVESLSWAYATGPVALRLGDVQITPATLSEAFDRRTNEVVYHAGRVAHVAFDDVLHVGIRVDYSL